MKNGFGTPENTSLAIQSPGGTFSQIMERLGFAFTLLITTWLFTIKQPKRCSKLIWLVTRNLLCVSFWWMPGSIHLWSLAMFLFLFKWRWCFIFCFQLLLRICYPLTVLFFIVVFLTWQAGYTMLAHDFHISKNMPHSPKERIVCMLVCSHDIISYWILFISVQLGGYVHVFYSLTVSLLFIYQSFL